MTRPGSAPGHMATVIYGFPRISSWARMTQGPARFTVPGNNVHAVDAEMTDLELAWQGDLGRFAEGDVTSVTIEIAQRSYRFRLALRPPNAPDRVVELRWSAS